jgi:hypothetical protein
MHANQGDERKDQAHTERRNNQSGGDASVMAVEVHHFSVVLLDCDPPAERISHDMRRVDCGLVELTAGDVDDPADDTSGSGR